MTYSKTGLALTEQFESCRLAAYQDVRSVWTIGWGHTGPAVVEGLTCTQEQADAWLADDINWAANVVNTMVKVSLTQGEFDALTDFVFNAGSGNFERSSMLKFLNKGLYQAAAGQFQLWEYAGGKKVAGLLRRRTLEQAEFQS